MILEANYLAHFFYPPAAQASGEHHTTVAFRTQQNSEQLVAWHKLHNRNVPTQELPANSRSRAHQPRSFFPIPFVGGK